MEFERYKLIYEIMKKNNALRILGEDFVKNNKNKGRIIYKNKKYSLKGLFKSKDINSEKLKIKMILSKDCHNKSCMFKNC